jgi:hypothetical protein
MAVINTREEVLALLWCCFIHHCISLHPINQKSNFLKSLTGNLSAAAATGETTMAHQNASQRPNSQKLVIVIVAIKVTTSFNI